MLEGAFVENIMMSPESRAYPQMPQITAGTMLGTQSIYRYGLRESSYPTLSLVEEIKDNEGNTIPTGHYELALSDNKDFLILIQSKVAIAIIPVFKVQVEISKTPETKDKKTLKREEKEAKEIAKTNKKRAKVGMPPVNTEQDIYQEATIEYIPDRQYYLIKYERGDVKAWGAIKD